MNRPTQEFIKDLRSKAEILDKALNEMLPAVKNFIELVEEGHSHELIDMELVVVEVDTDEVFTRINDKMEQLKDLL